jgi:ubiquinone/menaquinone biosynthesis C-methylase UbiE
MSHSTDWKKHWEERAEQATSDFSFNRGGSSREKEIEEISQRELINFIEPRHNETLFDAGCGTGSNMLLLSSQVRHIVGIDYSQGAVERCRERLRANDIENAGVIEGNITQLPFPDSSFDKVLCLSVLQYMDDGEVKLALTEFTRILKDGGVLILHVKNASSIYLSTLLIGKKMKLLLRKQTKLGYFRPYRWYMTTLRSLGFDIVDFNSFNLFILPKMPTRMVIWLQKLELRNYTKRFLRTGFVRRHGSDLKIKAILRKSLNA